MERGSKRQSIEDEERFLELHEWPDDEEIRGMSAHEAKKVASG
jgi:hypothetical protein